MSDQTRNLNPTPEAVVAMYLFGKEYSQQRGGAMDFYDSLPVNRQLLCVEMLEKIDSARSNHDPK